MSEFEYPKWTIHYNVVSNPRWVGSGWEFYDTDEEAEKRYKEIVSQGNVPTKRPYYRRTDQRHLGAAHLSGLFGAPRVGPAPDTYLKEAWDIIGKLRDAYPVDKDAPDWHREITALFIKHRPEM